MRIKEFFTDDIDEQYRLKFKKDITLININRGKLLGIAIFIIETILFMVNVVFANHPIVSIYDFQYLDYGFMYLILIVGSLIGLHLFAWAQKRLENERISYRSIEIFIVFCISFLLVWAAVISLIDQRLYGNVSAYLAALMLGSVMFYQNSKLMWVPYILSLSIFIIGLPYFQSSYVIIIGHCVNVGIFAVLSWLIAKILYSNYVKYFIAHCEAEDKNNMLNDVNRQLSDEVVLRREAQVALEKANQELETLSLTDDLTGIPNRRYLSKFLNSEWNRAIREGNTISVMMIDIDYFKVFNDNYGHLAGDKCLIKVAQTLRASCRRPSDFLGRLGGEEFLFLAVNIDREGSMHVAQNIRESIENLNIPNAYSSAGPYLTVSIGVSIFKPSKNNKPEDSVNEADRAMYNAKQSGRNKVIIHEV